MCHHILQISSNCINKQSCMFDRSIVQSMCTRCQRIIIGTERYCCDEEERLCRYCSNKLCPKCDTYPNNICKAKKIEQKVCCICLVKQDSQLDPFFFDSKSLYRSCFSCLLEQYQKSNILSEKGKEAELIELNKTTKIEKKVVLQFLEKYCFVCSKRVYIGQIRLKNGCVIMKSCLLQLENSVKNGLAYKEEKTIYDRVQSLIDRCCVCQKIIQYRSDGKEIDGSFFCQFCIRMANFSETAFQSSWKRQKFQKEHESIRKSREQIKMERKSSEKKGEKTNPHLVNASRYQQYKCQLCKQDISNKIQGQNICLQCYNKYNKDFPQAEEQFPEFSVHLEPPKINQRKEKFYEKVEKEGSKKKEAKQTQHIVQKQSKIELVITNNHQDKPIYGNQTYNLSYKNDKKKEENKGQIIVKEKESESLNLKTLSLKKANPSLHQQFFPLEPIPVKIKHFQDKFEQCIKCGYFISQNNSFYTYMRQNNKQNTLRIAQTAKQLQIYGKENRISIYCKFCYYWLKDEQYKDKMKIIEGQSNRIYRSLPKKQKKMEPQPLLSTYTEKKRDSEQIRFAQNTRRIYQRYSCTKCFDKVQYSQYNHDDKICQTCEKKKLKESQKTEKCSICKRNPITSKSKWCDVCLYHSTLKFI